jgi:hypothetical protein
MSVWEILDSGNEWVAAHKELLALLGIPSLTAFVTHFMNQSAEKRAAKERQVERSLARELKLSEYRQEWISEFRSKISEFASLSADRSKLDTNYERLIGLAVAIETMMDHDDEDFKRLRSALQYRTDRQVQIGKGLYSREDTDITAVANRIEKREWARLKSDLQQIEDSAQ